MIESVINIEEIAIANGMALILAVQLLFADNWKQEKNNKEWKYLRIIIYVSAIACVIDPIVFLADGHPGLGYWLIVYVGNMILFLDDIIVGISWITIVCRRLLGYVPKYQKFLIAALSSVGLIAIVVNLLVPVIFYVDQNSVYRREPLFWLFTGIVCIFLLDGVVVYIYNKVRGGVLKFFPMCQFVLPVMAGIALQGMIYGVSVVWPAVVISAAGLLNSFKTEYLFTDSLTGLLNRAYLNELRRKIDKKGPEGSAAALILDINKFKSINDRFGHAEGDAALIQVGQILKSSVGALGCVIRYAGDEFIILLNTKEQEIIEDCIQRIHRKLMEENEKSNKEYDLSLSIGFCPISVQASTIDDMINEADRRMYMEKKQVH